MDWRVILGIVVALVVTAVVALRAIIRRLTTDPCPDCQQKERGRRGRLIYRGDVDGQSRFCCNVCPYEVRFSTTGTTERHAQPKPPHDDDSFQASDAVMWILCYGFMAVYAATVAIKDGLRYLWYLGLGILVFALVFVALVLWAGWMKAARFFCGLCPDELCDGHLRFHERLVSDDGQFVIDQCRCTDCGAIVEDRTPMWLIRQEMLAGNGAFPMAWPS